MQNRYSKAPCEKCAVNYFIASAEISVAGLEIEWCSPKQHSAALCMRSYLPTFIVYFQSAAVNKSETLQKKPTTLITRL